MFLEREASFEPECSAGSSPSYDGPSVRTLPPRPRPVAQGGRYGEGRKSGVSGFALAIGVHLLIVPVLLSFGYQASVKQEDRFVSVNLTPPPAPPPAAQPETPERQKLETTIKPLAQTPAPLPQAIVLAAIVAAPVVRPVVNAAPPAPPAPPAAPATPSVISSDSLGARMVAANPPRYPVESRRKREQGTVELLLILGFDGAVEAISVARSSGFARLDDAALSAVRRWRWAPTSRNGTPVKVKGVVEIPFVLRSA